MKPDLTTDPKQAQATNKEEPVMGNGRAANRANLGAVRRQRRGGAAGRAGRAAAEAQARRNQRRRGIGPGGTFRAMGRLRGRNRPAGLTADLQRAARNQRRRNRAR